MEINLKRKLYSTLETLFQFIVERVNASPLIKDIPCREGISFSRFHQWPNHHNTVLLTFLYFSYFLKSGGDSRFEVEQTTGNIKVRQLLDDVAIHRVFTLEIEARDNGLQQLSARAVVQVKG